MTEQTRYRPSRYERPRFGQFGTLSYVGERLVCHICGRDYLHLAQHVVRTHGLEAEQYRDHFGLNRRTALVSASVSEKHRAYAVGQPWRERLQRGHKGEHRTVLRTEARLNRPRGEANGGGGKLTRTQVASIRSAIAVGESQGKIGARFGVSKTMVRYIAQGKAWAHVSDQSAARSAVNPDGQEPR